MPLSSTPLPARKAMKRRQAAAAISTGKKQRQASVSGSDNFKEVASLRERARPYRLAVGRLSLDVLDTTWSDGQNRRVDTGHVRELVTTFKNQGLQRTAEAHFIRVLCSRDEVRRVEALGRSGDEGRFLAWATVNESRVEVMGGQHRIEALRAFVEETDDGSTDEKAARLWWTCELYDRDRLPPRLALQMRMNRADTTLPDNHGQVWMQLVSLAAQAPADEQLVVERKLVESLCLDKSVPARRLVTLWSKATWRERTTAWLGTRLGMENFSISKLEWMASLRIDDYWLDTIDATTRMLLRLPAGAAKHITPQDWIRMAVDDPAGVFYGSEGERARGHLASMDDRGYEEVYRFLCDTPDIVLPGIHRLLRTKVGDARVMVLVLRTVVAWFDPATAAAIDDESQGKTTPLHKSLLCAVRSYLAASSGTVPGEEEMIEFQARVLDYALDKVLSFRELIPPSVEDPAVVEADTYRDRFTHSTWAGLLALVRESCEGFRPEWTVVPASRNRKGRAAMPRLVRTICEQVITTVDDPDLASNDTDAVASLEWGISAAITQFMDRHRRRPLPRAAAGHRVSGGLFSSSDHNNSQSEGEHGAQQHRSDPRISVESLVSVPPSPNPMRLAAILPDLHPAHLQRRSRAPIEEAG